MRSCCPGHSTISLSRDLLSNSRICTRLWWFHGSRAACVLRFSMRRCQRKGRAPGAQWVRLCAFGPKHHDGVGRAFGPSHHDFVAVGQSQRLLAAQKSSDRGSSFRWLSRGELASQSDCSVYADLAAFSLSRLYVRFTAAFCVFFRACCCQLTMQTPSAFESSSSAHFNTPGLLITAQAQSPAPASPPCLARESRY